MVDFLKKNISKIFLAIFIVFLLVYSFYTIKANTDLIDGRFCLFMDEQVSFDGVKKIFYPKSFSDFFYQVSYGDDLRYGRIFWYTASIVSFIPEKIWGDKGQIIATRFLQYFLIVVSYILLAHIFIKNKSLKFLTIITIFVIPTTVYFSTMPKPEPLQVFFLSLFLYFFVKNDFKFGFYYIFLGISFGAKISVLPLIPFFMLISFFKQIEIGNSEKNKILAFFINDKQTIKDRFDLLKKYLFLVLISFFLLFIYLYATGIIYNLRKAKNTEKISLSISFLDNVDESLYKDIKVRSISVKNNISDFEYVSQNNWLLRSGYTKDISIEIDKRLYEKIEGINIKIGKNSYNYDKSLLNNSWKIEEKGPSIKLVTKNIKENKFYIIPYLKYCINWKGWLNIFISEFINTFFSLVLVFIILLLLIVLYVFINFDLYKKVLFSIFFIIVGLVIANPILLLGIFDFSVIERYLSWTIFGTGHGADDQKINFFSWLDFILNQYTSIPSYLLILFIIIFAILFMFYMYEFIKFKNIDNEKIYFVILLGVCFLSIFPIMLKVKRLWFHYLHIGTIFFVLLVYFLIEKYINNKNKIIKYISIFTLLLFSFFTFSFLLKSNIAELNKLANRTKSPEHQEKMKEYYKIKEILEDISKKTNCRLNVYFDPNLYQLDGNVYYTIIPFWGPFLDFDKNNEVVVYYKDHTDEGNLPDKTNFEYKKHLLEKELFNKYVVKDKIYVKYPVDLDNVRIFIRNDLYKILEKGGL